MVVDMVNIVIHLNGVVTEMAELVVVVVLIIKTIQTIVKLVILIGLLRIIAAEIIIGVIVIILTMSQVQTVYFVQMDVQVVPPQHIALAVMQLSHTICLHYTYVVALPINSLIPLTNAKIVVTIVILALLAQVHALHVNQHLLIQMEHVSVPQIHSFNI